MPAKEKKAEKSLKNFEKTEEDLLREALKSYKERFLMATRLYKIQNTNQFAWLSTLQRRY